MNKSWVCVLGVALVCSTGCRQPDGPLPNPSADEKNEIGDLSRDMLAVAGGDRQAIKDMSDDISHLGTAETGAPLAAEMGIRVARALSGKKVTDQQALVLANQMYLTFAGNALSSRQVGKIQQDIKTQLTQVGSAPDTIDPVVQEVAAVQKVVTTTQRRWWQVM